MDGCSVGGRGRIRILLLVFYGYYEFLHTTLLKKMIPALPGPPWPALVSSLISTIRDVVIFPGGARLYAIDKEGGDDIIITLSIDELMTAARNTM
jgi:hypothetical protein